MVLYYISCIFAWNFCIKLEPHQLTVILGLMSTTVFSGNLLPGKPGRDNGSSPVKPKTAEKFGFASPATKGADEGIYVELGVARIHLCKRQGLRWPELTGTGPAAATGVRASAGSEFWCMAGPAGGRGHLLGANRVL